MHAEERRAALEVLDSGVLSGFYGSPGGQFDGGPQVRAFEEEWADRFGYRHAISTNSWSTGLMASIGALALEPGDEIVCPPFTMSASATAALFYGVIPVFVDIDPDTFCLDPGAFERAITPRTRAVMVVHLFGLPADLDPLLDIARRHNIAVVEDAAQAPLATYRGRPVGGFGAIGGFSLNYHKHIHTGEGGVIVTDRDDLALRCRLIRNHGENAAEAFGIDHPVNVIGANYRLTELQAAIGRVQLRRLEEIVGRRRSLAAHLAGRLAGSEVLKVPPVPADRGHAQYVQPLLFDAIAARIPRSVFVRAVAAELPTGTTADEIVLSEGYTKPLYLNAVYQKRIAIGRGGFPFSAGDVGLERYRRGICPVAEQLHDETLLISYLVREPLSEADLDDFVLAVEKVLEHADDLSRVAAVT
jgi:dTDP-4-amino-4,6-dideoxygalactose transaminase